MINIKIYLAGMANVGNWDFKKPSGHKKIPYINGGSLYQAQPNLHILPLTPMKSSENYL